MGGGGEMCPFGVNGVQGHAEFVGEQDGVLVVVRVDIHGVVFFLFFFILGRWRDVFAFAFWFSSPFGTGTPVCS